MPKAPTHARDLLARLSGSPLRIIKEGGKWGVRSAGRFVRLLGSFLFANGVLTLIAWYRLFAPPFSGGEVLAVVLVMLGGVGFTAWAGAWAYQFVQKDLFRAAYTHSIAPIFEQLSSKALGIVQQQGATDADKLKAVWQLLHDWAATYEKIPDFIQFPMEQLIGQLPLADMVLELKNQLVANNASNDHASQLLYAKIDQFMQENAFADHHTHWIRWLLPLNVATLGALIWGLMN